MTIIAQHGHRPARRVSSRSSIRFVSLRAEEKQTRRDWDPSSAILRLGPMHGVDDPYYVERYGAQLWAPGPSGAHPEPRPTLTFDASTDLPVPGCRALLLPRGLKQPEGSAPVVDGAPGLLITCDAIQNYGDYRYNNLVARLLMPLIGFPKTTVVGPMWVKMMTPEGASSRERISTDCSKTNSTSCSRRTEASSRPVRTRPARKRSTRCIQADISTCANFAMNRGEAYAEAASEIDPCGSDDNGSLDATRGKSHVMEFRAVEKTAELADLKQQYMEQTTAPLDGMWLCGLVPRQSTTESTSRRNLPAISV